MHHTTAATAVLSLFGFTAVLLWRVREGRTPVTAKKLLIPPAGMALGFGMFLAPGFRVPWSWGVEAFLIGAVLLAWPLLATSRLRREGGRIWMKRSRAFFAVIVVLALTRYAAREYFDRFLTIEQTGALFYLLAFGMIVRWRAKLYLAYRALLADPAGAEKVVACD